MFPKAKSMHQPEAAPRETIVSRTTMSYAFEKALAPYVTAPASAVPALAVTAAQAIRNGVRKRPAWTVSKRADKPAKRGRH